ncbi:unnamed protein product [Arctia plantaginis]|uniref:Uncharacterized protein n=1 Tax=Arctia plantaginis TaxID=874455 RepID=A0A8S0YM96_ARCPL|nr:unnamed protein product [Arctia plantaginis]
MDNHDSTDSNISLDSLENNFKQKTKIKGKPSDENVDTILVPFYEKDVLIKVSKEQKRNTNAGDKPRKLKAKVKKEPDQCYLVNKVKPRRPTYLEIFRKQFSPDNVDKTPNKTEIRSLSPQYGDTERESIEDDANYEVTDFYNTESYNDIYYEKLLNRNFQVYMDNSLDDLPYLEEVHLESSANNGEESPENLRSISEVSHQRRPTRRTAVEPVVHNLKLGGLGPDVEKIKPRLERARSLQRYSEKVRMENRLKIYKKTVQAENDKKAERGKSPKARNSDKEQKNPQKDTTSSYLVNRSNDDKNATVRNVYLKSKSADAQKTKERNLEKDQRRKQRSASRGNEKQKSETKHKSENQTDTYRRNSGKSNSRIKSGSESKGINTEGPEVTPVQISFLVNIGGVRPSSALKTLEEKHRMYQEQVKAFMNENNNG